MRLPVAHLAATEDEGMLVRAARRALLHAGGQRVGRIAGEGDGAFAAEINDDAAVPDAGDELPDGAHGRCGERLEGAVGEQFLRCGEERDEIGVAQAFHRSVPGPSGGPSMRDS